MDKITKFVHAHPQWTSWIALSIGMVAILLYSVRNVGLLAGQMIALIVATVAVAGLAVWIIGWEDEEESADAAASANAAPTAAEKSPKEA